MNDALTKFIAVLTGVTALAVVAVIVSKNSNSSGIISSFFTGFASIISSATAPVTGASNGSLLNTGAIVNGAEGGLFS